LRRHWKNELRRKACPLCPGVDVAAQVPVQPTKDTHPGSILQLGGGRPMFLLLEPSGPGAQRQTALNTAVNTVSMSDGVPVPGHTGE